MCIPTGLIDDILDVFALFADTDMGKEKIRIRQLIDVLEDLSDDGITSIVVPIKFLR